MGEEVGGDVFSRIVPRPEVGEDAGLKVLLSVGHDLRVELVLWQLQAPPQKRTHVESKKNFFLHGIFS